MWMWIKKVSLSVGDANRPLDSCHFGAIWMDYDLFM